MRYDIPYPNGVASIDRKGTCAYFAKYYNFI